MHTVYHNWTQRPKQAFNACNYIGLGTIWHPYSLKVLFRAGSRGDLDLIRFLRLFTLPNPTYLKRFVEWHHQSSSADQGGPKP